MLEKIGQYLQGKKAYAVSLGIGAVAVLSLLGVNVPTWVVLGLMAGAVASLRSAIAKGK